MNSRAASTNQLQQMIPLLMDVQQHLDQDLNLQFLAGKYDYSPFHFQRLFSNAMGEAPKEYVQRLRLERLSY
jgi:AraC family transcriptional regulator